MKFCARCAALAAAVLLSLGARAEVRLPNVFGDHMVLQRDKPIVIWGWALPGETVTIQLGDASAQARVNGHGEWKATLAPLDSRGALTLKISGSSTVEFKDIWMGEVWLCSGQSNMEMGVGMSRDGQAEIAAANHPRIRLLMVGNRWSGEPQTNLEGAWKVCSPKTLAEGGWGGFSAAAYYFGRKLEAELQTPVGLIDSTWGGTLIESWTPPEGFGLVPSLKEEYEALRLRLPQTEAHQQRLAVFLAATEQWLAEARTAAAARRAAPPMPVMPAEIRPPHSLHSPTTLYHGMIHPLCPLAIRGVIWYQGESNLGQGAQYTDRMRALIEGWRRLWGGEDFPFYFVQIAPFNYGGNPERLGDFWEAQARAQQLPNVGMVVINDIGDLQDIHPTNKQEVGRRLALWALAKTYGREGIVYSGPTFKAMSAEQNELRVAFDHVAGGLRSRDGKPLNWFEIIDADEGGFAPAQARIEGASVVLSAPGVRHPVAMRFAWNMLAEPNLENTAGLPTGAFRAGDLPKRDPLGIVAPESLEYQLVYDYDLAKLSADPPREIDNHRKLARPFDRIAYFLELRRADGETECLYVSMDAFTSSLDEIGIPTFQSGAHFQRPVSNLTVLSNLRTITTGVNLAGGNLEFWPNNYGQMNSAKIPGASDEKYDFGDQPGDPSNGYGSMQVHNFAARQTLFALNHWQAGGGADLGIGNQPQGNPDWTFAANAASYPFKRLRVLVRPR